MKKDKYKDFNSNNIDLNNAEKVGEMYTESNFTSSNFGDVHMHFRHQYQEHDFKDYPGWLDMIAKDEMVSITGTTDCGVKVPNHTECN